MAFATTSCIKDQGLFNSLKETRVTQRAWNGKASFGESEEPAWEVWRHTQGLGFNLLCGPHWPETGGRKTQLLRLQGTEALWR